jgi:hypothetical protein
VSNSHLESPKTCITHAVDKALFTPHEEKEAEDEEDRIYCRK